MTRKSIRCFAADILSQVAHIHQTKEIQMTTDVDVYAGSATAAAVQGLMSGVANVVSTITGEDVESRLALFEATTDSLPLIENLNKPIKLANLIVQVIDINDTDANGTPIVDEATGEVKFSTVPRTVLIAEDGTAYHAISQGVFKSVQNIIGILGKDPAKWGGLTLKAVQGGSGTRKYMTLVPVKPGK
jgi:hypothetical protein